VIAVCGGLAVLVPSLALLFALFLRGRLDTPETARAGEGPKPGVVGARPAGGPARATAGRPGAAAPLGLAALLGLAAGAGLLVFADAPWTRVLGVAGLLLCAVAVFALAATPPDD
jgi:hypothetical protein